MVNNSNYLVLVFTCYMNNAIDSLPMRLFRIFISISFSLFFFSFKFILLFFFKLDERRQENGWATKLANLDHPVLKLDASVALKDGKTPKCLRYHAVLWPTLWKLLWSQYFIVIIYNICFICSTELFHTERSHVRNLKVLDRVFYRPLLDNGFSDLVNLLFPNLPDMLEIHGRFNTLMKARKRDQPAVETVGDILVAMVSISLFFDFRSVHSMRKTTTERSNYLFLFFIWKQFDGPNGEAFQQAAATFCKYQSVALESLRDRRKKDSKLQVRWK